ncbi:MAG: DUF4058 domain-containing protein [Planctomycetia bacterium]|nr:DUF4058 domain-containing protein [Planctomycetia bacterium]
MPLFDHFHPPVLHDLPWESLHSGWVTFMTTALNQRWLTHDFIALEQTHGGRQVELEVAKLLEVYTPPQALTTIPGVLPDVFEVRVFATRYGRQLVGAIELVSPGNKDRSEERQAFVAKCANYLAQGVSVVILDIVTTRQANLHNELLHALNAPAGRLPDDVALYAAAYRPVLRGNEPQIDVWAEPCAVGTALPTMPLRLTGDLFVPVEFELTYLETCRQRRLIG